MMGRWSALHFMNSKISSFGFLIFNVRLFSRHHRVSLKASSLKTVSSPPETTVVSNFIMEMEVWEGEQSCEYSEYKSGLLV